MDHLDFPEMRRRWNVRIFWNELAKGQIKKTIVQEYKGVRSIWITGEIVRHDGMLKFVDQTGKEIVASSVPFLATEVERASIEEEQRRASERRRAVFTPADGIYRKRPSTALRRRVYKSA